MSYRTAVSRRAVLATAGAVVGGSLAGCLAAPTATDDGTPEAGARTYRLVGHPIRTLDPANSIDGASDRVVCQIHDGLFHYPQGNVEPEPLLVDEYDVSPDGRTYTFDLVADATFHDGRPVRARDVVYSFERLAASDNSRWTETLLDVLGVAHRTQTVTTDAGRHEVYRPGSLAVEAVDDHSVEMRLSEPFHAALQVLALPSFAVVPEGIVGDVPGYDGEMEYQTFASDRPVGAGPFAFESWSPGTEYSVTAVDSYYRDGPHVGGIHWTVLSDPEAAYNFAMNENADAFWIPSSQFDPAKVSVESVDETGRAVGTYGPLRNGKTARYRRIPSLTSYYLGFNTESVPRPVRRAVAYVFDQSTVTEEAHRNRGEAAYHLTPPNIFPGGREAYRAHARERYPYGVDASDIEAARRVVERAGYDESNPASLTFTTYPGGAWQHTGQLLRDALASAHVELELETTSFQTMATRGANGALEMFSWGWSMDYPEPDSFLQLLDPSTETVHYSFWDGTDAAARAGAAWETVLDHSSTDPEDRAARERAFLTLEEANWEDVVLLPAYHPVVEAFYYPWVDLPKTGPAGFAKRMYDQVRVGERS